MAKTQLEKNQTTGNWELNETDQGQTYSNTLETAGEAIDGDIKINIATKVCSITNNTSGGSSSGTINRGSQIKISEGYNTSDKYYTAQANSGTKSITTNGTHSCDGYANVNVNVDSTPEAFNPFTYGQDWYQSSRSTSKTFEFPDNKLSIKRTLYYYGDTATNGAKLNFTGTKYFIQLFGDAYVRSMRNGSAFTSADRIGTGQNVIKVSIYWNGSSYAYELYRRSRTSSTWDSVRITSGINNNPGISFYSFEGSSYNGIVCEIYPPE